MDDQRMDIDYFEERDEEYAYISRSFTGFDKKSYEKRFVQKKFNFQEDQKFEKTRIKGEYILRSSPTNKVQLKVVLTQDSHEIDSIIIQTFNSNNPQGECVSFHKHEFHNLLDFLEKMNYIDLSNKNRFRIKIDEIDTSKVLVDKEQSVFIEYLKSIQGENRELLLESLSRDQLTKMDLDIISGRKSGLEEFRKNLFESTKWDEPDWQKFFANNTWIFGYGLDYRFLKTLRKEAHISNVDLDGKNEVIIDFLLGTTKFTVLVEIKKPETPLFTSKKDRSESWQLSDELTFAISQILSQKAEWEIKSKTQQFDSTGQMITQNTYDPKTILIMGNSVQYSGTSKNDLIKGKTFELFRRNSKNIEIITFDELYERAYFIVNQKQFE
jgi:hypothetical protein